MKTFIHLSVVVLLLATVASAQTAPKGEVFGGYSYVRQSISPTLKPFGLDHVKSNGWMAGGTGYFNDWFGIKAEINGVYAHPKLDLSLLAGAPVPIISFDESVYTYTFGPTVAYRKKAHFQPFAHALFGVAHMKVSVSASGTGLDLGGFSPTVSDSTNAFAMQYGGGVDVPINRAFAIRGQADWLPTRFNTGSEKTQNHFKFSAGIVFRFGGK